MKTRTQFTHRVDMWDDAGQSIIEHLDGVEDFDLPHLRARRIQASIQTRLSRRGKNRD
jgi:hypothetical protein